MRQVDFSPPWGLLVEGRTFYGLEGGETPKKCESLNCFENKFLLASLLNKHKHRLKSFKWRQQSSPNLHFASLKQRYKLISGPDSQLLLHQKIVQLGH